MDNLVRCPQCGNIIGEIRTIDGREFLFVNGLAVNFMRGACSCGTEFYWSISERMLAELIRRVLSLRENQV